MNELPPEPYEGTEPYLFVSYSHKNCDRVWSAIAALQARGYRVWYDKGIQVGTEYNDIIAEKLKGCTALLSFNTDELFDSEYCMQELLYAANKKKKIANICFPLKSEIPSWYELRFETTYQQIYRDRFATEENFLDELCRADILKDCLNPSAAEELSEIATPGLEYKKIYDSTLGKDTYHITGYDGDSTEIIIPGKYKGLPVTSIGWPTERHGAFIFTNSVFLDFNDLIRSITIPDSVTCIDEYAFSGCTSLTSINIPDSVTRIGDFAFDDCASLTSITVDERNTVYHSIYNCLIENVSKTLIVGCKNSIIPIDGSVTSIGEGAFSGCTDLTNIEIPNSVTSIGKCAFSKCTGLTSINIPNSVASIGKVAFSECENLTSIEIPNSVTRIGIDAFSGCSSLTSITVDERNTVYHSIYNCLIENVSKTLIVGCKNSIIPIDGSVTSIGEGAFSGCTGLTNIEIPNSVTRIGKCAFSECTGLTSINIPNSVASIGRDMLDFCYKSIIKVHYRGTADQWDDINIEKDNYCLITATRYYYSESEPTTDDNFWHYVDGVVTEW